MVEVVRERLLRAVRPEPRRDGPRQPGLAAGYEVWFTQNGERKHITLDAKGAGLVRGQILSRLDWPDWNGPRVKILSVRHAAKPESKGEVQAELAEHLKRG